MASFSGLTPLQRGFIEDFFRSVQTFYLTGGAALVGYYGLARHTDDLDLFTQDADAFRAGPGAVEATCQSISATCTEAATYPHFRHACRWSAAARRFDSTWYTSGSLPPWRRRTAAT